MPPISAPIEVPAIATISKPCASISSITPMCASPLAPPAPSASAMVGLDGVAGRASSSCGAVAGMFRRHGRLAVVYAEVGRAVVGGLEKPYGKQDFRGRSEEHTSELQSLMRISYAVFGLKKK